MYPVPWWSPAQETCSSLETPAAHERVKRMHEMGIVQSIMDIVKQQAEQHQAKRVVRISLEFGLLTAVMPDAIQFAFDVLSQDTVAQNADLEIRIIPIKAFCVECDKSFVMEEYQPFCPECQSAALHIIEGRDEMRIASLEVEDW
jgi:hydrogenase nickel incorporation protein HypA/HybF